MPVYLGTHKLKELYVGGHKIKEAYLGSTKVYSAAVAPTYEIWTNDSSLHTNSNGSSSTAWSLNVPSSTSYQYVLLRYNVYAKVLEAYYGGWCGVTMYISSADYSRNIEFRCTGGSSSNFSFNYIYALTSIFTGWNNASGITTNTTGTESEYTGTYRYVKNTYSFYLLCRYYLNLNQHNLNIFCYRRSRNKVFY